MYVCMYDVCRYESTFCLYLSPVGDFDDFKWVVPTIIGGALYESKKSYSEYLF